MFSVGRGSLIPHIDPRWTVADHETVSPAVSRLLVEAERVLDNASYLEEMR